MSKRIHLTQTERASLLLLIGAKGRPKALPVHYARVKPTYDDWGNELINKTVTINKEKQHYSDVSVISILVTRISEFDGKLFQIANHPESRQIMHVSYKELCQLLARNSIAWNFVAPGAEK